MEKIIFVLRLKLKTSRLPGRQYAAEIHPQPIIQSSDKIINRYTDYIAIFILCYNKDIL